MKFSCYGSQARAPGCHAKCEIYAREKAVSDARREEELQRKIINSGLKGQRSEAVYKARKKQKKGK